MVSADRRRTRPGSASGRDKAKTMSMAARCGWRALPPEARPVDLPDTLAVLAAGRRNAGYSGSTVSFSSAAICLTHSVTRAAVNSG
jgi:hypothetical protein